MPAWLPALWYLSRSSILRVHVHVAALLITLFVLSYLSAWPGCAAAAAQEFDNDSAPLFMSCVRHAQLLTLNSPGARITHTQRDREGDTSMFALPNQQSAQIAQLCHGPPLSPSRRRRRWQLSRQSCRYARRQGKVSAVGSIGNISTASQKRGAHNVEDMEELPLKECAASCAQIMKSI